MPNKFVPDASGWAKLQEALMQDRMEFVADMRSKYEDLAPKDTGDLARSAEQVDSLDTSILQIMQSYAPYIEFGTKPFKGKLVGWKLSKRVINQIKKMGGKVVYSKDREVLIPVWHKWVRRKLGITTQAKHYIVCWRVWYKIAKKGITPQRPLTKAMHEMRKRENHYHFTNRVPGVMKYGS